MKHLNVTQVTTFFFILFFSSIFTINAQETNWTCGTPSTNPPLEVQQQIQKYLNKVTSDTPQMEQRSAVSIPVKAYIVNNSAGFGGISESSVNLAISQTNQVFQFANIQFDLCGVPQVINDDVIFNFNDANENYLTTYYYDPDVINLYFVNSLIYSGGNAGGYARFPWDGIRVAVIVNNSANSPILAHEFGHTMGLLHTHETAGGTEFVNGQNCGSAGDYICDTPADPNLSLPGMLNNYCQYVGYAVDPLGWYYSPYTNNLMSYAHSYCINSFTNQQLTVINQNYFQYYQGLNCSGGGPSGDCDIAPQITAGNILDTEVDIFWDPVPNASGYNLELRQPGVTNWTQLNDLPFQDVGAYIYNILPCTYYEVRITAVCGSSISPYSNEVGFTTTGCSSPYIFLSQSTANVPYIGNCFNIFLESNTDWSLFSLDFWIYSIFPSWGSGSTTITLCYDTNFSSAGRTGNVVVTGLNLPDQYITVNQDAYLTSSAVEVEQLPFDWKVLANPGRDQLDMQINLTQNTPVAIVVYNSTGQQVARLEKQTYSQGEHLIQIPAIDWANGLYFIQLVSDDIHATQKWMLQ